MTYASATTLTPTHESENMTQLHSTQASRKLYGNHIERNAGKGEALCGCQVEKEGWDLLGFEVDLDVV